MGDPGGLRCYLIWKEASLNWDRELEGGSFELLLRWRLGEVPGFGERRWVEWFGGRWVGGCVC